MISPALCLSLAAVAVIGGSVAIGSGWAVGWLGIGAGLWLLGSCLRSGGVPQAFAAFKDGDMHAVRTRIHRVPWVRMLSPQNRAYYQWLKGAVLAADGALRAARKALLSAATGAIQTENDRSLIHCLLAEVSGRLGEQDAAHHHLQLARSLDHQPGVDAMIEAIAARLGDNAKPVAAGRTGERRNVGGQSG